MGSLPRLRRQRLELHRLHLEGADGAAGHQVRLRFRPALPAVRLGGGGAVIACLNKPIYRSTLPSIPQKTTVDG